MKDINEKYSNRLTEGNAASEGSRSSGHLYVIRAIFSLFTLLVLLEHTSLYLYVQVCSVWCRLSRTLFHRLDTGRDRIIIVFFEGILKAPNSCQRHFRTGKAYFGLIFDKMKVCYLSDIQFLNFLESPGMSLSVWLSTRTPHRYAATILPY